MDPLKKLSDLDPAKKAFSLAAEFKNFALKGNVIDLAVGVIIGAAFGKIIASLVEHIFLPLIALLFGGADDGLKGMSWRGVEYGNFLAAVVNFLLVALILFVFAVKFLGWVMRSRKEEAAAPAPLTKDQELLIEIRDLLKKNVA